MNLVLSLKAHEVGFHLLESREVDPTNQCAMSTNAQITIQFIVNRYVLSACLFFSIYRHLILLEAFTAALLAIKL